VLHQGNGSVVFFSKPIVAQHVKLTAYEQELIGLIQAVKHWSPYLWGTPYFTRTDHFSLKFFLDQKLSRIPQHRWARASYSDLIFRLSTSRASPTSWLIHYHTATPMSLHNSAPCLHRLLPFSISYDRRSSPMMPFALRSPRICARSCGSSKTASSLWPARSPFHIPQLPYWPSLRLRTVPAMRAWAKHCNAAPQLSCSRHGSGGPELRTGMRNMSAQQVRSSPPDGSSSAPRRAIHCLGQRGHGLHGRIPSHQRQVCHPDGCRQVLQVRALHPL
jgi:hypothetical protein